MYLLFGRQTLQMPGNDLNKAYEWSSDLQRLLSSAIICSTYNAIRLSQNEHSFNASKRYAICSSVASGPQLCRMEGGDVFLHSLKVSSCNYNSCGLKLHCTKCAVQKVQYLATAPLHPDTRINQRVNTPTPECQHSTTHILIFWLLMFLVSQKYQKKNTTFNSNHRKYFHNSTSLFNAHLISSDIKRLASWSLVPTLKINRHQMHQWLDTTVCQKRLVNLR